MTEVTNKNGIFFDIDAIATDLNNKMDRDGLNSLASVCVESYQSGTSGYRVYSDGYCEQWGISAQNIQTIQLLKTYANTNYIVFGNIITTDSSQAYGGQVNIQSKTTSSFTYPASSSAQRQWRTFGYIN